MIRKANNSDIPQIKKLNQILVDYDRQFDETIQPDWIETTNGSEYLHESLTSEDSVVLVSENDNQINGFLIGCVTEAASYRTLEWLGELEEMVVLPEYRGKKIGEDLVRVFVEWCRSKGLKRIKVEVSAGNSKGLNFYQKQSFGNFNIIMEREI